MAIKMVKDNEFELHVPRMQLEHLRGSSMKEPNACGYIFGDLGRSTL